MILRQVKISAEETQRRLSQLCGKDYELSDISVVVNRRFFKDTKDYDYYWDSKEHNWILNVPGLTQWSFEKELVRSDDEAVVEVLYVYDHPSTKVEEDAEYLANAQRILSGLPEMTRSEV